MSFEPKHKVELDPTKDDIISVEYLSKCDGASHRPMVPHGEAKLMVDRHEPRLSNLCGHKGRFNVIYSLVQLLTFGVRALFSM